MLAKVDKFLIEGWRRALTWWSVQWQLVTSLFLGAVAIVPSMPGEIANFVPEKYRIAAVAIWAVLGIYARLKPQKGKA